MHAQQGHNIIVAVYEAIQCVCSEYTVLTSPVNDEHPSEQARFELYSDSRVWKSERENRRTCYGLIVDKENDRTQDQGSRSYIVDVAPVPAAVLQVPSNLFRSAAQLGVDR